MGRYVVQQGNGLYAMFSTIVDSFIMLDATREDIINEYIDAARLEAVARANNALKRAASHDFRDCLETVAVVHGREGLLKLRQYGVEVTDNDLAWADYFQYELETFDGTTKGSYESFMSGGTAPAVPPPADPPAPGAGESEGE